MTEPTIQNLFDLTGKVALITGGSGFLGKSFSRALAEAGASVVIASRVKERAEQIAHDLTRKARRGTPVATSLGALLAALGRHDEGTTWIEAGLEARESLALLAGTSWLPLDEFTHSARLQNLLERRPR